ncbi:MAG: PrsW family intramembrane metalloprotease [Eubacterium sp.]|nr:PrsW family intramembrane metalloprotease [Eubacterium sp.]
MDDSNMIFILFICIFVPLLISVPLVQKQSRDIVIYILTGLAVALFVSEVNGIMLEYFDNDMLYVTTTITPITEEVVKAIPVLMFVYCFPDKRDRYLSIAFACGVGFALFENSYILVSNVGSVSLPWALARGFSAALMHGICTAAVGYGMTYVRLRRKLAIPGTIALLILAIIYHGIFNIYVQATDMKYVGFILPGLTYLPIIIYLLVKGRKQEKELKVKSDG